MAKFTTLQYRQGQFYSAGWQDIYLVLFLVVVLTAARAMAIRYLFHPFAKGMNLPDQSRLVRFGEQSWTFCYYLTVWLIGVRVMYSNPHWLSLQNLWADFPHPIDALFKLYYLIQFAFCLQCAIILHVEKPRKDYFAMLIHHIATILLMGFSYAMGLVRVGNAVLVCMDMADYFLSLSKAVNYFGRYHKICDALFTSFFVVWILTRHLYLCTIIYSIYAHLPLYPIFGPGLIWIGFHRMYLILLCVLEVLCVYWLILILKIAFKVAKGANPEDERSDDEKDD